jgi:lipoyl(octanoyl) transferase
VNTDLSFFNLIVPCGITSKPVTSMERELGRQLPLADVASMVRGNFAQVFRSEISWVASLDELFGGVLDLPARPPSELRQLRGEEETFWA